MNIRIQKSIDYTKKHPAKVGGIALVAIIAIWWGYGKLFPAATPVKYVTAQVTRGTIISTVSGTGQVAASNQLDIKPKVSADVIALVANPGDKLKAGDIIAKLDATDAEKSVRDARNSYESAKLSYAKLVEPADQVTMAQSQDAITQAQADKTSATASLAKAYNNGFNDVAATFLDLSTSLTGIHDILYNQHGIGQYTNSVDEYNTVNQAFQVAQAAYDKNLTDYKATSLYSDNAKIGTLIDETIGTAQTIASAIKATNSSIQDKLSSQSLSTDAKTSQNVTNLNNYTDKVNSDLQTLIGDKNSLQSSADTIASADNTVNEKTLSLQKLQRGADPLDVQTAQLNVTQKANALQDAEDNLADYTIRAPFDCVVADIPVKVGDPASGGTTVATVITSQQLANVSLNEVDVAKVKLGDKVTVTFDAIPDLTITGKITQIDSVGTVSQGVVNYNVQIAFDMQDDRVKPGMSMTASIVTAVQQDTLLVPSSAVKNKNGSSQVSLFLNGSPVPTNVQTGITSDSQTEITNGLNEGDTIVTQTITGSAAAASATSQNSIRIPGITGGGGGGGFGGGRTGGRGG